MTSNGRRPVVPIASAIVIQGNETVGPFRVETLSPSRVGLRSSTLGHVSLGQATVVMSLAGLDLVRVQGDVIQVEGWEEGVFEVFLDFKDLDADLENQIQEAVAGHLERSLLPVIVVLDGGSMEARHAKRDFHRLGRDVVFFQSSLEALWFLERYRDDCDTILIDASFIQTNGAEILPILHDQYLDKRRVLIAPRHEEATAGLSATLWSMHGVLPTPWRLEQLESALGLYPADRSSRSKRLLFADNEAAALSISAPGYGEWKLKIPNSSAEVRIAT